MSVADPVPGARGVVRAGTIEVRSLTKRFGQITAVDDLSFTVEPGRITGFLGPNGAGKTTTLRILLDLVSATGGTATIGGRRYRDIPNPALHVGAVLEATNFHPSRRARAHLKMLAIAAGIDERRIDVVLDLVGLSADGDRKVGGYSLGMRQRLQLAGALLGDPGVLVLDEPSNGLDPQGIAWLRDLLRHLAREGKTVLVSSHLLAEMAQTVDDVVIVSRGRLRVQGPLSVLTTQAHSSMRVRTPEVARLRGLASEAGLVPRPLDAETLLIDGATPEALGPLLAANQVVVYEVVQVSQDLESLFLELTTSMSGPVQPMAGVP
jgi:ABC-2 type transport system ATP-binding protein